MSQIGTPIFKGINLTDTGNFFAINDRNDHWQFRMQLNPSYSQYLFL